MPGNPLDLYIRAATLLGGLGREYDPRALNEAIALLRQAFRVVHLHHPLRREILGTLSTALMVRSEREGDYDDIDEAVSLARTAVDGGGDAQSYVSLGNALGRQFELTAEPAYLDEAIDAYQCALADPDPGYRAASHGSLSYALLLRFLRTGAIDDVDRAIRLGTMAGYFADPEDPEIGNSFASVSKALVARYDALGAVGDLDDAIRFAERALSHAPSGHPLRGRFLVDLSDALRVRFLRRMYTDVADSAPLDEIDRAIALANEAVAITRHGHHYRAAYLEALANAREARFGATNDIRDLRNAIERRRDAVAEAASVADAAGRFSNLAHDLVKSYMETGRRTDLDDALTAAWRAVELTPAGNADRAHYLAILGLVQFQSYLAADDSGDGAEQAMSALGEATTIVRAPVGTRAKAASALGDIAAYVGRYSDAVDAYQRAIQLLPLAAWRGVHEVDSEFVLGRFDGVGGEAAACAILVGKPYLAPELLEHARAVMWSQALDLRADLLAVRAADTGLADRLEAVRVGLGRLGGRHR
ncbi:hypothetical protein CS0771_51980 [Catellatospora sp. IY07-71]|uniref:hypothetical protein n=1 Tax=Catellatospora sp. IY07-71 TaxID=2728827 RepID=UPI001BB435A5|nr:hypothetical protein [Catellatospora sp. IY07-71]BCJ75654.1 hypothetical protein CS0771_51980 [Catellatospora sp. IY07-71]